MIGLLDSEKNDLDAIANICMKELDLDSDRQITKGISSKHHGKS